ncbi:MAG: hypothetical protein ACRDDY_04050 [Clostridium sp.]|uniref:hypothetical protein n=1 Tax=Clostridium sp. TaxID=1506 RepID=UPI003EE7A1B5
MEDKFESKTNNKIENDLPTKKLKPIYKVEVAYACLKEGFVVEDTKIHNKFEGRIVFYFEKTKELKEFVHSKFGIVL